jgi:GTP cyclohydrolase II
METTAGFAKSEPVTTDDEIGNSPFNLARGLQQKSDSSTFSFPSPPLPNTSDLLYKDIEFTDAELFSKFGAFNIRVYKEPSNRETVVLWNRDIPLKEPVLTRVHSECLTGDIFGSQHCDCGQQLSKSLRLISERGGVLIYLRQEGRGIGLFEKIRSYKLQSQGYDTFEANLMLGHNPDIRSYEMVKIALRDLGIEKVVLLTNNPSKVSDISSLGVSVADVQNLYVKPCKHNRKYLETKRAKFSHFSVEKQKGYQYQFFASSPRCIRELKRFLKDKNLDPLLKICAAIPLDTEGLSNRKKVAEILKIIRECNKSKIIQPVLHFSCTHSTNPSLDLKLICNLLPEINLT